MSCFLNPLILFLGPYLSPNSSTHTFYLSETAQCIRLQEKKRSQNCQSAWNTNNQHEEITFDQAGLTPDTKSSNLPQSISKTYICICKCSEKLIIYIAILILKNSTSWPQLQTLMRESFRLNKVSSNLMSWVACAHLPLANPQQLPSEAALMLATGNDEGKAALEHKHI